MITKSQTRKSCVDLLRIVKTAVNIEEENTSIKVIEKTIKGDFLLEVAGRKGKAQALKQHIQQGNSNATLQ